MGVTAAGKIKALWPLSGGSCQGADCDRAVSMAVPFTSFLPAGFMCEVLAPALPGYPCKRVLPGGVGAWGEWGEWGGCELPLLLAWGNSQGWGNAACYVGGLINSVPGPLAPPYPIASLVPTLRITVCWPSCETLWPLLSAGKWPK